MKIYLQAVITGKVTCAWKKKEDRVIIFFEEDEQVDEVLCFLSGVMETIQTDRGIADQLVFRMDVLLPEVRFY